MLRSIGGFCRFFSTHLAEGATETGAVAADNPIVGANHPRPPRDTRSTKEIFDEHEKRLASEPAFREECEREQASLDEICEQIWKNNEKEVRIHINGPHKHGY